MTVCDLVPQSWRASLDEVLSSDTTRRMGTFLDEREAVALVHPPRAMWLSALALAPLERVSVVILGQDPYHGPGQAHGLAFSVPRGVRVPPSLANIYKELHRDLGLVIPADGDLTGWARQGVLLLNNALTVEDGRAGSHRAIGWEPVTDAIIAAVAARARPCVFLLWGNHAQKKVARVPGLDEARHLVLRAPHPSPLSAHTGFLGCGHFSATNRFLQEHGQRAIDWNPG